MARHHCDELENKYSHHRHDLLLTLNIALLRPLHQKYVEVKHSQTRRSKHHYRQSVHLKQALTLQGT